MALNWNPLEAVAKILGDCDLCHLIRLTNPLGDSKTAS